MTLQPETLVGFVSSSSPPPSLKFPAHFLISLIPCHCQLLPPTTNYPLSLTPNITLCLSHRYPLLGFHDEVVVLHGHGDDAAVGRGLARVVVTHGVVNRGAVVRGQHLVELLRRYHGEL